LANQFVQFIPTSVESARQWWHEGGEKFLASYLELEDSKIDRWLALAPEFRDTLTPNSWAKWQGAPQVVSLPRELFCSHNTQPCDPEAMSVILASEQDAEPNGCNLPRPKNRTEAGCKQTAKAVGTNRAFKEFVNCVDWRTNKSLTFPVGSFNLPRVGWLVVSGTRGYYSRCTGTRAYNLEDGSSYRAEICGQNGMKGIKTVEVGRVAPTYLRRFLFLSMLRPYLEKRALEMDVFRLPAQVPAMWTSSPTRELSVTSCRRGAMIHQSKLNVQWWNDRTVLSSGTSGTALWHGPVNNIDGYIAKQLYFAESAFLEGCVYSRLPDELQKGIERNDSTVLFKDQSFAPALCK